MARKSSFLQGFEVGADLYNRGYSQAMGLAEMAQRKKDREYQRTRDEKSDERAEREHKLRTDAAELAKRKFELEIKEWEQRQKANKIKSDNFNAGMSAVKNAHDFLQFFDPLNNKADYQMWHNDIVPTLKKDALLTETTEKQFMGMLDLVEQGKIARETIDARSAQKARVAALREAANEDLKKKYARVSELGLPRDIDDATFRNLNGQISAFTLDISEGNLDLNDDRLTEFRHAFAQAGGDAGKLTTIFKEAYKPVAERQRKHQETLAAEARKKAADIESGQRDLQNKKDLFDHENSDLSQNPDGVVESMALNGQPVSDFKTVYPSRTLRSVDRRRNEIKQGFVDGKYVGEDRIRLSGVFTDKLTQTESEAITKSLRTLKQIDDIDFLQKEISTGPVQKALTGVHKLIDTEEGRDRAIFEGALNAMIPGLARGTYGEVGVLTDADIENYKKTVSSLGQQEAVNQILIDKTRKLVRYSVERQLSDAVSNQKNVSGYLSQYRQVTAGKTYDFQSEEAFRKAREAGQIPAGAKGSFPEKSGGTTHFTMPDKPAPEMVPQGKRPGVFQGKTREEIQQQIESARDAGQLSPGQKVKVIDPETGSEIMLTVPGGAEPAAGSMAPMESPQGQPSRMASPEVERDSTAPAQSNLGVTPTDYGAESDLEKAKSEPVPGKPMEPEPPKLDLWMNEEHREGMVNAQLKEEEARQELLQMASDGGGEDPYAFLRHRVKVGGQFGEIVRTNSRGVFVKFGGQQARFLSWAGLSKAIDAGNFKFNKARLNQQLKGE